MLHRLAPEEPLDPCYSLVVLIRTQRAGVGVALSKSDVHARGLRYRAENSVQRQRASVAKTDEQKLRIQQAYRLASN